MTEKYYITTPIYYPSGKFHIGNTYTTLLAQSLRNYARMQNKETYFLTGIDEHGQKISEKAKEKGITVQEYVDTQANAAKKLWEELEVDYNIFMRTTNKFHEQTVQKIFEKLFAKGDIYKGQYSGKYCTPCETFFAQTQLVDEKCPDCGREVKEMKEEAYFFNMKKYVDKLIKYYDEHPDFIKPEYRKTEMINNFIKPGLEDLCVTRTSVKWGIPLLNEPNHTVYVWLDALTNYITALGYMQEDDTKFQKLWPADMQVVGKDIARFHLVYWPIFLMALDLPLPKTIFVHNFIMMKDGKMSKSKGNVIYPEQLSRKYGTDALKYFLLREMPLSGDATFSPEGFVERYNFDLCNDLSNLLNRTISMVNKYLSGKIDGYTGKVNEVDKEFEEYTLEKIDTISEKMDNIEIANSLAEIWTVVSRTNKYIDETAPWTLAKEGKDKELKSAMYHLVESLRKIAILITPFMEKTANNIFRQIGIEDKNLKTLGSLKSFDLIKNLKVIEKGEPIFMRLNIDEEVECIKNMMKQ